MLVWVINESTLGASVHAHTYTCTYILSIARAKADEFASQMVYCSTVVEMLDWRQRPFVDSDNVACFADGCTGNDDDDDDEGIVGEVGAGNCMGFAFENTYY